MTSCISPCNDLESPSATADRTCGTLNEIINMWPQTGSFIFYVYNYDAFVAVTYPVIPVATSGHEHSSGNRSIKQPHRCRPSRRRYTTNFSHTNITNARKRQEHFCVLPQCLRVSGIVKE